MRMDGYLSLNWGGGGGSSICKLSRLCPNFAADGVPPSEGSSDAGDGVSSTSEFADFSLNGGSGLTEKASEGFAWMRGGFAC